MSLHTKISSEDDLKSHLQWKRAVNYKEAAVKLIRASSDEHDSSAKVIKPAQGKVPKYFHKLQPESKYGAKYTRKCPVSKYSNYS